MASTLVGNQPAPARKIPRSEELRNYLQQSAIIGETRRFKQLDRFEAHYACRQYQHLNYDWWGQNADNSETISPEIQVPYGWTQPAMDLTARQKRPTAPYNLCKAVVDRFTGLLFSDQRRPDIDVEGDEDTQDFLRAAADQMRMWSRWRQARTMGGALGAVLVTVHLRNGEFSMEVHNPKHCQVVWADRRSLKPAGVLKIYRYPVEEDVIDEKTGEVKGVRTVFYLYRRIISEYEDVVYKPVRLDGDNTNLDWEEESRIQHDLGFFPGVWVQNMPVLEREDGEPDCAGAWQNFDTLDRLIAQMNKAVLLNLDPTIVLAVDPKVVDAQGGVRKGSDNALQVGQGGSAAYMEITGTGITAGRETYNTLKANTLDVVRCVLVDPEKISGSAQSAKAIEYIYAPMLEKADDLRAQYGDQGVVPLLQIVEKIARKYDGQTVDIGAGRAGQYRFRLPPRKDEETGTLVPRKLGPGGFIAITWGPYFAPTEMDKQAAVQNIVAAKVGGLLDTETAIRKVAAILDVADPEQVLAKVREEEAKLATDALGGFDFGVPPGGNVEVPDTPAASPVAPDMGGPTPPAGTGGKG